MNERYTNYTIIIELDNGETLQVKSFGASEYHARDKAHSKHLDIQKDISKYAVKKPLINCL